MGKRFFLGWLVFLCSVSGLHAQTTADQLILVNANIIDGKTDRIHKNQTVYIKEGRIESIGEKPASLPDDTEVIDVQNHYVLPGLIDAHVHVSTL